MAFIFGRFDLGLPEAARRRGENMRKNGLISSPNGMLGHQSHSLLSAPSVHTIYLMNRTSAHERKKKPQVASLS